MGEIDTKEIMNLKAHRETMIEVVTVKKLVETLFPEESDEVFVCERDENGKVLVITDVWEYLQKKTRRGRGVERR